MSPRKRRTRSIATRLFFSSIILSFAILLIAGLVLTTIYRSSVEASFDERLGVYLRALVVDIATTPEEGHGEPGQLGDPRFESILSGWYWQITRLDVASPTVRSSRSLFAARLPRLADAGVPAGIGGDRRATVKGPDDRLLRIVEKVIDAGDQGTYLVQVAGPTDETERQISHFEIDLLVTFALLALALIGSSALQLRFGLRPLRRLQEGVAAIRRGEDEKIDGDFPQDIAPLASELNLLISANRDVVERARTQVGNLAHALKTPLSVIINEAETDRSGFGTKVRGQATLMRDQVAYYLDRARAAVRAGTIGSATEVAPVVEALTRTFEKIYRDRDVIFHSEIAPGLRFLGERQDLEEMLGNLVDNAGKWTHQTVQIAIASLPPEHAGARSFFTATIDDDGPGLAPELRQAAMRRGQRLDETKPGSGLGLSIVVDLAALYGGALALEASPAGGLRAALTLPAL